MAVMVQQPNSYETTVTTVFLQCGHCSWVGLSPSAWKSNKEIQVLNFSIGFTIISIIIIIII